MALGDNVEDIEPAREVPTEVTASVATEKESSRILNPPTKATPTFILHLSNTGPLTSGVSKES
jgi:hypothetical protein